MYIKKPRRGRKESVSTSKTLHRITKKMRENAPPDDYSLTEEEVARIHERNLNNPKIPDKIKQKYAQGINRGRK